MQPSHDTEHAAKPREGLRAFLETVAARARLPRHVSAATATAVTMCTLVSRLTRGQAFQLLATLPEPVQPLLEPCVTHRYGPVAELDDAAFLQRIADRLEVSPAHAEQISDAVFATIRAVLPPEVNDHVARQLPHDLRDLWLGTRAPTATDEPLGEDPRLELLAEIEDRAPLPFGVSAVDALAVVVCAFSRRLSGGEARDVFLGLPDDVRELVDRCVADREEAAEPLDRERLIASVSDTLGAPTPIAEEITCVVLSALQRFLPTKEIRDVASQLPTDLRDLWPVA
jgi:uncharacterized protein (DUF2267 family)